MERGAEGTLVAGAWALPARPAPMPRTAPNAWALVVAMGVLVAEECANDAACSAAASSAADRLVQSMGNEYSDPMDRKAERMWDAHWHVTDESGAADGAGASKGLPKNADDLLEQGYRETSHPKAAEAGHRSFENPETGDSLRFDKGKPGRPGHAGKDHYHRPNPSATGKQDAYLDADGNPVPDGSDPSHLYP